MTRINTNIASMVAQTHLTRSTQDLNTALQRLSSGLKINRGADDPAGLIASESLRGEIAGITQAIANSQRAANVITTAEGALNEVSALLVTIQELIVEAGNTGAMSEEEIEANQLQIDSAVESITRISNVTEFGGLNLLNGNLAYAVSGVDESAIKGLDIYSASFGSQDSIQVIVSGVTSAQQGQLFYKASSISNTVTIEVVGNKGVEVFTFVSGTKASAIAFAINRVTDSTGVTASVVSPTDASSGIVFSSQGYGSSAFVSVRALPGSNSFQVENSDGATVTRDTGVDAVATINGALTVGDGLEVTLNTTALDLTVTLDPSFGTGQTSFAITGGGAVFQLGPNVATNQQINLGIRSVAASNLGDSTVGFLSDIVTGGSKSLVAGEAGSASQIVEKAIKQVAVLRGRLGSFEKNILETNVNSLQITLENVTASESVIRDTDFATEVANLTRAQILVQAGTSVLSIANSTPQSVLALLA